MSHYIGLQYCIITSLMTMHNRIYINGRFLTQKLSGVQRYAFDYLDAPVMRITSEDVPMSYSPPLVEAFLPNPEKVIKRVKELMYIKN